jgi:circadian clock protein KaiC
MAVVKVRASAHSDELREYTVDASGIRIGERLADQEGLLGGRPTRLGGRTAAPGADGG